MLSFTPCLPFPLSCLWNVIGQCYISCSSAFAQGCSASCQCLARNQIYTCIIRTLINLCVSSRRFGCWIQGILWEHARCKLNQRLLTVIFQQLELGLMGRDLKGLLHFETAKIQRWMESDEIIFCGNIDSFGKRCYWEFWQFSKAILSPPRTFLIQISYFSENNQNFNSKERRKALLRYWMLTVKCFQALALGLIADLTVAGVRHNLKIAFESLALDI